MSAAKRQGGSLGIAIVIAVLFVALVVFATTQLRFPKDKTSGHTAGRPAAIPTVVVTRVEADNALSQQVELFDPKPLFLPTPINNSDPALPGSLHREPGSVFRPVPPKLTFAEYEMNVVLPEPIEVPASPLQAIRVGEEPAPYFAMGHINYPFSPLSERLAYMEVVQARTGKVVLAAPLLSKTQGSLPADEWKPLEMTVAVEASGLVGQPTITSGSDSEEIDTFFRNVIVRDFNLGAKLAPGFYTLRVGP